MAAVFLELVHLTGLEPLQGLESVASLSAIQCFAGEVIQAEPESQSPMNIFQNIEGGDGLGDLRAIELPRSPGVEDRQPLGVAYDGATGLKKNELKPHRSQYLKALPKGMRPL